MTRRLPNIQPLRIGKTVLTLLLFFYFSAACFAQTDSSVSPNNAHIEDTTEADPYPMEDTSDFHIILLFGLIGLVFIGIGVVATMVLLIAVFALVTIGALSSSFLIGMYKKSISAGFKAFFITQSMISFALLTASGLWVTTRIMHWEMGNISIVLGAIIGLLAGLAFGLIGSFLFTKLSSFLKERLDNKAI